MKESDSMSAWRAGEAKDWTQALLDLNQMSNESKIHNQWTEEMAAIRLRLRSLLGIADDE